MTLVPLSLPRQAATWHGSQVWAAAGKHCLIASSLVAACTVFSGAMEAGIQETGFQVRSSLNHHKSCVLSVFSSRAGSQPLTGNQGTHWHSVVFWKSLRLPSSVIWKEVPTPGTAFFVSWWFLWIALSVLAEELPFICLYISYIYVCDVYVLYIHIYIYIYTCTYLYCI